MVNMRYKPVRYAFFLLVTVGFFSIFSCQPSVVISPPTGAGPSTPPDVSLPAFVQRVELDNSGSGSVTLTELSGNDLYLVKVNTSGSSRNASTTVLSSVGEDIVSGGENEGRTPAGTITLGGKTLTRYEPHWPVVIPSESQTMLTANQSAVASYAYASTIEGSPKSFYVDPDKTPVQQKDATLKKVGAHCKIWVADENFTSGSSNNEDNKVTQAQIDALANKFDAIYPLETNLLGYEYGGGSGGNGGVDGDPKIQILVYDIGGDFGNESRTQMTLGYFYSGDEYQKDAYHPNSNEAEIFYLDCETLDGKPGSIHTTLIHEFNHMINFNVKVLAAGNTQSWNTEVWYTEMLSMLAEDAIGPLVGIPYASSPNGHVILERIPTWLFSHPSYGVMQWRDDVAYYSSNYAFGAYLVRNFGGPALLSHIAKSSKSGRVSLNESLAASNGLSVDVQYALARFGETMVFSGTKKPEGVYSFDNTVSGTIGSTTYTFHGFDIWQMSYGVTGSSPYTGPRVLASGEPIPAYGVQIISSSNWKSKNGSFTVQIANGDNGVYNFVMVR